ncbi:stretch-activated Ca-permeable channel [Parathielavia hyrcaniae]|uniref:Stretch-activated Ca-permeable channel n=1 Tax=Parathielavia hyrcaniae TaxID=113614 RepID=A0AAN6T4N7_9PEZI|nr:stretch-activated Ca-permeable channel [Parathielavia hyrcaniae]
MQFSPLQSRLAASLVASCLLILLYLFLFPPNFALAAELREALPVVFDDLDLFEGLPLRSLLDSTYEPDFPAFDRSIIGRAPAEVTSLTNNEPMPMNVEGGTMQRFVFALSGVSRRGAEEDGLEARDGNEILRESNASAGAREHDTTGEKEEPQLARRQAMQKVYISATTCLQPQPIDPSKTTVDPPQLTLLVSTSAEDLLADPEFQDKVVFNEGAVMYNLTTDREVYIGIQAQKVSALFSGTYNFQIAASTDNFYYSYNEQDDADLIWVDSDSQGALLITHNLTDKADPAAEQQIMSSQPYVLFAHNEKDPAINGLKHSYCGLQNYAQIAAIKDGRRTSLVRTGMTRRGPGNLPKQQFFFSGLNSSSTYIGILAKAGADGGALGKRQTAAAGGTQIFKPTNFTTKSDHGNCALIIDLAFCDQIAYSVPSNPNFGNSTQLAQFYDGYAASMYANFNKSLAQIACEAPSSQRYSLARNCTDCAGAYKDWLCSVTIPRCEDFSNPAPHLQPRAVGQPFPDGSALNHQEALAGYDAAALNSTAFRASRNPAIDEVVRPGPYKELLPCDDLCYKLVQSCPAQLGFGCPVPGQIGFEGNYARHDPTAGLTCNFPGSAHVKSRAAGRAAVGWGVVVPAAVLVGWLMAI